MKEAAQQSEEMRKDYETKLKALEDEKVRLH